MLRSVAGITESFTAAWIFTGIWFLASMRPKMSLEIFQSRVSFEATLKLYLRKFIYLFIVLKRINVAKFILVL